MSSFNIDFWELCFLAEACIPPRPVARTIFWHNLTNLYYHKMTKNERDRLFDFMNRNSKYEESLKTQEDTQIFHARFDPNNQYRITTDFQDKEEVYETFLRNNKYYISGEIWISQSDIVKVEKITPKIN
jgi:hypothetical protein